MTTIRTLPVYDTNGVFLYYEYVVTGDSSSENLNSVVSNGTGGVIDLSNAPGNDTFFGGGGDDTVAGNSGNDSLNGGDGTDILSGGDGNDRVVQDSFNSADLIDGGAGIDTLDYSSAAGEVNIAVDLATGTVGKYLTSLLVATDLVSNIEKCVGTSRADSMIGGQSNDSLSGGGGNDTLSGGAGNDTLSGDEGNDGLVLGGGNDTINGGNGNDYFLAMAFLGNSTMDGGAGADTLDYSQSTASGVRVVFDLAAGTASKFLGTSTTLIGIDTFRNIEQVIGGA